MTDTRVSSLKRRNNHNSDSNDEEDDIARRKCRKVSGSKEEIDVRTKRLEDTKCIEEIHSVEENELNGIKKQVDWMSLPKEVWSSIFHWIPARDKVSSRLVSKDWKQNVDSLSSFAIQLHERLTKEELNRYFGMRIHSIELMSLKKPIELGFQYPNYVRELVVTTLVSPRVFSSMCQIFTEVQALRVVSTFKSDTTFDPSNRDASVRALQVLRKLKEVDITIHGFGTRGLWACETFNVIIGGSLIFSHLTIVNINMMMHHEEMESFFQFLIRHRKSLKCVTARIGCMVTSVLGAWPDVNVKFSEAMWFEELKKLTLQSLHIFRAHTCGKCDIDDVWSAILQNQSALVKLTADYRDVGITEFFDILRNNPKLRSCNVYRLTCNFHIESPVVDSRYRYLEELTLDFVSNVVLLCNYLGIHQVYVDFLDFKNLPSTLRKLSIRGYTLPQHQFVAALKDLKHVEELNLGDCLFSDKASRFSSFKQVCKVLSSEACGVRRLIFDSFDDNAFDNEKDPKIWESIQKCAKDLGILHECFDINADQQPVCDFRFTKEKMRQFADFVEAVVSGDGVVCSVST